jgi:hypothetical protein
MILKAVRPFKDDRFDDIERYVDDEYLLKGPGTYYPRIDEMACSRIEAIINLQNTGLLLKAKRDTIDENNKERKAGSKVEFL